MPDLDQGLAPDRRVALGVEPVGPTPLAPNRQPEDPIARTLGDGFRGLYTAPEIAQANYRSLSAFAGSGVANDLISNGGAGRLAPLRPDLTRNQFAHLPSALGAALGDFAPHREGALAQVVPGAQVVRDAEGVPLVAPARGPAQRAAEGQGHLATQRAAGFGMEGRVQYGYLSGSAVVGIVFDEDSFGTFITGSAGFGVGAGSVAGPTGFAIVGPDEITDISGLGVQFGGFMAAGTAKDFGLTVPVAGDGSIAGGGVTFPLGPTVGGGAGIYSELGYTRVDHLFELSDLQSRGGAVLEDLSGAPRLAINTMMAGLGIRSYDEMARHLIPTQASIARQMGRLGTDR